MSKYRFKTQDEFIRDGQWDDDNHCPEGWAQNNQMNHYLGQDVPEGANENCDLHEGFEDDGWWFEPTNYVLKEPIYKVGQWYKSTPEANKRNGEIYYAKYLSDDFKASDYKVLGDIKSIEYKFSSGYIWELLTDLSEIQEFLPDNHEDKIVKEEEDYTGMYIKALVESPNCTGVYKGDSIKIISKKNETQYVLDKTKLGIPGMKIRCPLERDLWELVEENSNTLDSFPSSGAILISECDNLKEFKRYLFDSGRTCNEAVGNPKYLAWNDSSFWYPTTSTSKTMYQWNELKHFIPVSKAIPGYVRCVQALMHAKVGKVYPVVDEKHCLCENGDTYEWDAIQFTAATKQEYDAQFSNEQDPLYICKQKYRKGMRVRSASKTGMYSGEFIIDVDPKDFRNLSGKTNVVDYTFSKGYLYYNGEYAEILEEGVYDVSEIIKTNKPSIESVHSVDVNLRTKKQINKFKF
jgi:hypothetical protein